MNDGGATLGEMVDLISRILAIDIDPATITADTSLTADLMLDSISLISLLALAEEQFGISFAEHGDAVAQLRTVGDAQGLVESLLPARV